MRNEPLAGRVTRTSLVERLRGVCDQASWQEFYDQYQLLIYHVARRAGLSEEDAEDCVQETILKVVEKLPSFRREHPGSFRGWLCTVTRMQVKRFYRHNHQHDRRRSALAKELITQADSAKSPELDAIWDEEWQRNLLRAALERVKRQVSPRQFQIFHCLMLQNWSVEDVCRQLDVSRGSVYVAKHRVNAVLKLELDNLKNEQ